MTSKKVVGLLSVFLAMMLVVFGAVSAPAGKPGQPPGQETPATADLPEHPNAASDPPACVSDPDPVTDPVSVFSDGQGTYQPEEGVLFRTNGDLWVTPPSGSNRELDLFLPADICALVKPGTWAKSGVRLSIQEVRDVPDDGLPHIVGLRPLVAPDYTLGYNHYFYWVVDSNLDGKFGRGDTSYNVVWQYGISVTRNGNVYVLSTDGTSGMAVLRYSVGKTVYLSPEFYMPLNLTVTRQ